MCSDSRRADLLAVLGNRSQPEGTRKSGPLEKEYCGPLGNPISLAASRANGLGRAGHEENWFLRKKYGTYWWDLDFGLNRGNEEKWFRKENVPWALFGAELEGLPESR